MSEHPKTTHCQLSILYCRLLSGARKKTCLGVPKALEMASLVNEDAICTRDYVSTRKIIDSMLKTLKSFNYNPGIPYTRCPLFIYINVDLARKTLIYVSILSGLTELYAVNASSAAFCSA